MCFLLLYLMTTRTSHLIPLTFNFLIHKTGKYYPFFFGFLFACFLRRVSPHRPTWFRTQSVMIKGTHHHLAWVYFFFLFILWELSTIYFNSILAPPDLPPLSYAPHSVISVYMFHFVSPFSGCFKFSDTFFYVCPTGICIYVFLCHYLEALHSPSTMFFGAESLTGLQSTN